MVRIEREDTEAARLAQQSLVEEKAKRSGTYNTPAVNDALQEIFCEKCYICESKNVSSWQIEHLIPHKEDKELKFFWDNLFLACAHCNNIKGDKYTPTLDCTKVDVDEQIAFHKVGYFGIHEELEFMPLVDDVRTKHTCELLKEVYYGDTPQKKAEGKFIRKHLRDEMSRFKNYVREYTESNGRKKQELYVTIVNELSSSSPFTAFKRWLIRDHKDVFGEFMSCWKNNR